MGSSDNMDPLDVRRSRPAASNAQEPLRETASQTAGPYVHIGCLPDMAGLEEIPINALTSNGVTLPENKITIKGQVFEGDHDVCKDIMLEFWQADAAGSYEGGIWLRAGTDLSTGIYEVETILPGAGHESSGEPLSPFISVWVVARGINIGLMTRIYFPDHQESHVNDPHLALVPEDRRHTLIAKAEEEAGHYRFDIHLQGDNETVFFDI